MPLPGLCADQISGDEQVMRSLKVILYGGLIDFLMLRSWILVSRTQLHSFRKTSLRIRDCHSSEEDKRGRASSTGVVLHMSRRRLNDRSFCEIKER